MLDLSRIFQSLTQKQIEMIIESCKIAKENGLVTCSILDCQGSDCTWGYTNSRNEEVCHKNDNTLYFEICFEEGETYIYLFNMIDDIRFTQEFFKKYFNI